MTDAPISRKERAVAPKAKPAPIEGYEAPEADKPAPVEG